MVEPAGAEGVGDSRGEVGRGEGVGDEDPAVSVLGEDSLRAGAGAEVVVVGVEAVVLAVESGDSVHESGVGLAPVLGLGRAFASGGLWFGVFFWIEISLGWLIVEIVDNGWR